MKNMNEKMTWKGGGKRLLSFFMAFVMVVGMLPAMSTHVHAASWTASTETNIDWILTVGADEAATITKSDLYSLLSQKWTTEQSSNGRYGGYKYNGSKITSQSDNTAAGLTVNTEYIVQTATLKNQWGIPIGDNWTNAGTFKVVEVEAKDTIELKNGTSYTIAINLETYAGLRSAIISATVASINSNASMANEAEIYYHDVKSGWGAYDKYTLLTDSNISAFIASENHTDFKIQYGTADPIAITVTFTDTRTAATIVSNATGEVKMNGYYSESSDLPSEQRNKLAEDIYKAVVISSDHDGDYTITVEDTGGAIKGWYGLSSGSANFQLGTEKVRIAWESTENHPEAIVEAVLTVTELREAFEIAGTGENVYYTEANGDADIKASALAAALATDDIDSTVIGEVTYGKYTLPELSDSEYAEVTITVTVAANQNYLKSSGTVTVPVKNMIDSNSDGYEDGTADDPWRTITYTDGVEDEEIFTDVVSSGELVDGNATPDAPTGFDRPGYTFNAWAPARTDTVNGNVTYEAQWTINQYTVTFKNGGNELQSSDWDYGTTPKYNGAPPTKAEDDGYTYSFAGWDVDEDNKVDDIAPVGTTDVTYTAVFTPVPKTFIITWVVNDVPIEETYEYGDTPVFTGSTDKSANTQYTYTFIGWSPAITTVTGDTTYTAVHSETVNTYTITWVVEGQDDIEETYEYGALPAYPNGTPSKDDGDTVTYTFAGWSPAINTVVGNATYNAQFTTVPMKKVTFKVLNDVSRVSYVESGEKVDAYDAPVEEGYAFDGWFADEDCTTVFDFDQVINNDTTVHAKMTKLHTVSFDTANGSTVNKQTVRDGEKATKPADPTKNGYAFKGWFTTETGNVAFDFTSVITANTTVYAQWAKEYTVTFNTNGGEPNVPAQVVVDGGKATEPAIKPDKQNATFLYWYLTNAGEKFDFNTKITSSIELWAAYGDDIDNDELVDGSDEDPLWIVYITGATNTSYTTYESEKVGEPAAQSKEFAIFDGWTKTLDENAHTITFTAKWLDDSNNNGVDDASELIDIVVVGNGFVTVNGVEYKTSTEDVLINSKENVTLAATPTDTNSDGGSVDYLVSIRINNNAVTEGAHALEGGETITATFATRRINGKSNVTIKVNGYVEDGLIDDSSARAVELKTKVLDAVLGAGTYNADEYTVAMVTRLGNKDVGDWDISVYMDMEETETFYVTWNAKDGLPAVTLTVKGFLTESRTAPAISTNTISVTADTEADFITAVKTVVVARLNNAGITADNVSVTIKNGAKYTGTGNYTVLIKVTNSGKTWIAHTDSNAVEIPVTATVNQYTVTWNADNGTVPTTVSLDYGAAIVVPANPTKTSVDKVYIFTGWEDSEGKAPTATVTGNVTYTAKYAESARNYTLTFLLEDGETILDTLSVPYGTEASAIVGIPAVPAKEATAQYTYTGNDWGVQKVTGNASYTASYTPVLRNYTLTFKTEDGKTTLATLTVPYGTEADAITGIPALPAKEANAQYTYTPNAWNVADVTGDATYTASYTPVLRNYTITWNAGEGKFADGTTVKTTTVAYGQTPEAPEQPTKTADDQSEWKFGGWGNVDSVTGTATYTATYTRGDAVEYTVTWYDEDGKTVLATAQWAYGSAPNYVGETPTKTGTVQYSYTFDSWTPVSGVDAEGKITGAASYKASYKGTLNKYTVTWVVDGTETEEEYEYGAMPSFKGSTDKESTAQNSYKFTGWDKTLSSVTGNVTYIAQYETLVNKYTVTWIVDGAETTEEYEYGAKPSRGEPQKDNYTFAGWSPSIVVVTQNATYTATWEITNDANNNDVPDELETATITVNKTGNGTVALTAAEGATLTKNADGTYTLLFNSKDTATKVVSVSATPTDDKADDGTVDYVISNPGTVTVNTGDNVIAVEFGNVSLNAADKGNVYISGALTDIGDKLKGLKDKVLTAALGAGNYTASEYTVSMVTGTGTYSIETSDWKEQLAMSLVFNVGDTQSFVILKNAKGTVPEVSDKISISVVDSRLILSITAEDVTISAKTEPTDVLKQVKAAISIKTTNPETGAVSVMDVADSYLSWDPAYAWPADEQTAAFKVTVRVNTIADGTYSNAPSATLTLTCTDTTILYTIKYLDGLGNELYNEKHAENTATPTIDEPIRQYYDFKGWTPNVDGTVKADAFYTATWKPVIDNNGNGIADQEEKYTVIYELNYEGAETPPSFTEQTWGAETPTIEDPTRDGYNFLGWSPAVTLTITAPEQGNTITYTAQWTQMHAVIFMSNGEQYETSEVKDGEPVAEPDTPVWDEDHDFLGWYIGDKVYDFDTPVTGNLTLTAKWREDCNHNDIEDATEQHYTITYIVDGVETKFENVLIGVETPTIADPTKENYKFSGWTPAVGETVTADATYTAQWLNDSNNNKVDDALETITIEVTGEGSFTVNGESKTSYVYDSTGNKKITIIATPVVNDGLSETYVAFVTGADNASGSYGSGYVYTYSFTAEGSQTITVNFAEAKLNLNDERLMNYYDGMPDVKNEDVYNTIVDTPEYAEATEYTITYKARGPMTHTVQLSSLGLDGTLLAVLKEIVGDSFTFDMEELWLDVNVETEGQVKDSVSLDQAVSQYLTTEKIMGLWDIYKEAAEANGGLIFGAKEGVAAVRVEIEEIYDNVYAAAMYYGAHNFGYNATGEETVTEEIKITYKNAAMYVECETDITLKDLRATSFVKGENVSVMYRDYTDEELIELIGVAVTDENNNVIEGVEAICIDIEDPYTFEGKYVSETAYELTFKFKGDETYKPSEATFTVTVTKATVTEFDAPNVMVNYGEEYSLEPTITLGNKYGNASELTDSMIQFFIGLDISELDVDGDGVHGLNGKVQLILPEDLQSMLDGLLGLVGGNVEDGVEMTLSELMKYLETIDDGSLEFLHQALEAIQGITETAEITIVLGGEYPSNTGAYLYGEVTTATNYETAYDVGYIIIKPNAERVYLDWNYTDSNGIFTWELLQYIDFDASAYNDEAFTDKNNTATEQTHELFFGIDEEGNVVTELDNITKPEDLGNGAFLELAFIAEFGNDFYYAVPIVRPVVIVPNAYTVEFVDEKGNVNNDRHFVFDNQSKSMKAVIKDGNGKVITPDANDEWTLTYTGLKTNTQTYSSTVAPKDAGGYVVTGLFIQKNDNGDVTAVGIGVGIMAIEPTTADITADNETAGYEAGKYHDLSELIHTTSAVEGLTPDTTVITAQIANEGDFSENGWSSIEGNINVDFPKWLDDILMAYDPDMYESGLTATQLAGKIEAAVELFNEKITSALAEMDVDTAQIQKLTDGVDQAVEAVTKILRQIPDEHTLTFLETEDVKATNIGVYVAIGIVTDSNHYPMNAEKEPAIAVGTLVIHPNVYQTYLKFDYEDENNIWTKKLLEYVDLSASAYDDEEFKTLNEDATALVRNLFLGIDTNGQLISTYNEEALGTGAYTQVSFVGIKADNDMYYAVPIVRAFILAPDMVNVAFEAPNTFTYDGQPKAMKPIVTDLEGNKINYNAKDMTVTYIGLEGDVEFYNSTMAPSQAGVYAVIALYLDKAADDTIDAIGVGVSTLTIQQSSMTLILGDMETNTTTVTYNGKGQEIEISGVDAEGNELTPDAIVLYTKKIKGETEQDPDVIVYSTLVLEDDTRAMIAWIEEELGITIPEETTAAELTEIMDTVVATAEELGIDTDTVIIRNMSINQLVDLMKKGMGMLLGDAPLYIDTFKPTEVGTYDALAFSVTANYGMSYAQGTLVIEKIKITLQVGDYEEGQPVPYTKTCNAEDPEFKWEILDKEKLLEGDAELLVVECSCDGEVYRLNPYTVSASATFPEHIDYYDITIKPGMLKVDHLHGEIVVTAPTCTEKGYTTYTCACGDSYVGDEIEAAGHDYEAVVTAPTCTEGGYTTYTCSVCGDSYVGNEVEAAGHDYETVVTDPTCTEGGYTTYTCSVCGDSYTADEVEAKGHSYDAGVVTTNPTCTAEGVKTFTCSACGDSYTEAVAMIDHKYESVVTAPTCTTEGYTTYTCAVCGDSYTADKVSATGHTYEVVVTDPTCTEAGYTTYTCACGDSYVGDEVAATGHDYETVVTDPTCTEGGYTTYTCSVCGDSYTAEETPATGHNYEPVVTAPTCTEDGYTTYTCSVCGDSYVGDEVAATGHDYETVVTAPTCTEDGYTTYTCSVCGDSYVGDEVAATGHDYEPVVTAPTCTEKGYTTYTCACGDSYVSDYVDALGHSYDAGVVTTEPTCTEKGVKTFTCSVCGDTYTEDVDANGHTETELEAVEPTCMETGLTAGSKCTVCGATVVAQEVIPATGHKEEKLDAIAPTCTETGLNEGKKCSVCGTVTVAQAEVAALGHSYTSDVTTQPSCTTDGVKTFTCAVCGDTYTEAIKATGHDYVAVVTNPTCTEAGYTTYTCDVCGDSYVGDEVAATGHDYETVVTAPACTEKGYTTYTCACGDSYVSDYVDALGHKFGDWTITKEPSETEEGSKTRSCTVCGEVETVAIPKTDHECSYKAVVTAPTCTEKGYTTYTCTCGDSYVSDYVDALGHSYDNGVQTKAPSCTEAGEKTFTCATCGDTYTESIEAPGHKLTQVDAKEPTCFEGKMGIGWNAYEYCNVCDYNTYEELPRVEHTYVEEITKAPTCTETGEKTFTCDFCEDTYTEEIAMVSHEYDAVVTAPTCTEGGYTTYTCACGDSYVADQVAALEHDYEGVVTTKPTCTEPGEKTYTCKNNSKHTYTEPVAALGHKDENGDNKCDVCDEILCEEGKHIEEAVEGKAATCTETGLTAGVKCSTCGKTLVEQEEIPVLGHDYEGVVTTKPTCTKPGEKTYTCKNDSKHTYTEPVAALGHKDENSDNKCDVCGENLCADGKHIEKIVEGKAATCEETGLTEGKICTACGKTLVEQEEIPALGHDYEGKVTTEPTCTKPGVKTFTCKNDSKHTYTEPVAALGHKDENGDNKCDVCGETLCTDGKHIEKIVEGKAATCTEPGLTEGKICTACGKTLVKQEEIPALGHSYTTVVTEPTCTKGGYTTYTCTCGHSYTADETPAKGHTYGEVVYTWSADNSECKATITCTCGDSLTETGKSAYEVVKPATETEKGEGKYTVSIELNGKTYTTSKTVEIAKLDHTHKYGEVSFDWDNYYAGATASIKCCDAEGGVISQYVTAAVTADAGKLTFAVKATLNGTEYTDTKIVEVVNDGEGNFTLKLPEAKTDLMIVIEGYNMADQAISSTVLGDNGETIAKETVFSMPGNTVKVYFLNANTYQPVMQELTLEDLDYSEIEVVNNGNGTFTLKLAEEKSNLQIMIAGYKSNGQMTSCVMYGGIGKTITKENVFRMTGDSLKVFVLDAKTYAPTMQNLTLQIAK